MENNEAEAATPCMVCKQCNDEDVLVYCDGCNHAYHTYCMTGCECCAKVPNRQFKRVMEVPEGDWFCKHCRDHLPALPEGESPKTIMYGWGDNASSCLGSGLAKEVIKTPTLLTDVSGEKIVVFDCGEKHSVVLTESGMLYTCGNGESGVLGFQDIVHESLDHFRRVDFFQSTKISKGEGSIVDVISSADDIFAVTKNGHLYGWGGNEHGELGHMDYKPKRLPKKNSAFREMNVAVKKLVMGDHHTLVLGSDNIVYAMGDNSQRQLGVSNTSIEWSPKKLCQEWKHDRTVVEEPDFPGPVTRIFTGGNSSVCVDKKENWYMWGSDMLKLGNTSEKKDISFMKTNAVIPYPMIVDIFEGIAVKDIAMGTSHMLVLDDKGAVYSAGDNSKGQLGRSDAGDFQSNLTKIEGLPEMRGIFAMNDVSCCYGSEGIYMWGDGTSLLIPQKDETKSVISTPMKIDGLSKVICVKGSNSHIFVQCETENASVKRDAAPEEDDAKKVKVDA